MDGALATSRYTFRLPLQDGFALYNARTGGVMRLQGGDAGELSALLSGPARRFPSDALGAETTARLRRGGFLIEPGFDELEPIRERYWSARGRAPVVLLITTTMDCNLGCYYCYESRSSHALQAADVDAVVAIARERLQRQSKRTLHIDWYGGEPLLNVDFMEAASAALQSLCASTGVTYHASAISNGTCWPEDVAGFVARHKLRQVQISFDGLQANHDKRRHFRRDYRPSDHDSSFDRAVQVVDRLLQCARVDVRYNADPGNASDFAGFLEFAAARGWFDAPFRCVIMPARLAAFSERSQFMRRRELSDPEFEALEDVARSSLSDRAQDDQDIVAGFLAPKTAVCGALASDSAVVGADGLEYRCGLQVGETHRAVGRFDTDADEQRFPDGVWWEEFDPTTLPTCSECSFLPVCWGGCPKRHLEESRPDVEREGRFWRHSLPRLIAAGFGEKPPQGFAYGVDDQFRDGLPAATCSGGTPD